MGALAGRVAISVQNETGGEQRPELLLSVRSLGAGLRWTTRWGGGLRRRMRRRAVGFPGMPR